MRKAGPCHLGSPCTSMCLDDRLRNIPSDAAPAAAFRSVSAVRSFWSTSVQVSFPSPEQTSFLGKEKRDREVAVLHRNVAKVLN